MMRRWMGIISDSDGLDAVIQLADDPSIVSKKNIAAVTENAKERAQIEYVFDYGERPQYNQIGKIVSDYKDRKSKDLVSAAGGSGLGEYMGYELRKRYANGNLLEVSWIVTDTEMKKIRNQSPYKSAIDILTLVLNGKGKTVNPRDDEDDVQDYIDIMKTKLKKAKRKGYA